MAQTDLDRFRALVLDDQTLQAQLRATSDRDFFIDLVVDLGSQRGYQITRQDVIQALYDQRQSWLALQME